VKTLNGKRKCSRGEKKALCCGVSEKPCSDFASCFVFLLEFGEMKKVTTVSVFPMTVGRSTTSEGTLRRQIRGGKKKQTLKR